MNKKNLIRSMKTRHLVMLSLGGAIGTGLFISSGEVINRAGALGAVIAYLIGGAVTYMVMMCLGELAAQMPISNSFSAYATKYIGPATGYVVAWTYWLTWALTLGVDFTGAAILMGEWFPQFPIWIWIVVFTLSVLTINLYSTKAFAETEFYLALIKVATVVLFLILGTAVILNLIPLSGNVAPVTQYFNHFSTDNLLPYGIWPIITTMLIVSFSFTGTELIAVAAGETQNPAKNIPKAIKATFWRLLIIFIGTIVIMALLFPHQQLGIANEISSSPFVIFFNKLNIPYSEDIIRFVIITALLSSANAGLYGSSRMMWSLSKEKLLPNWLSILSRRKVPVFAIILTILGGLPGLLLSYYDATTVLNMLMDVAAFTMVFVWISICISQFNFRKQYIRAGKDVNQLIYKSPFYPYLSIIGTLFLSITALSMLIDPDKLYGFIACMIFFALCYGYYHLKFKKSTQK